jgi:hypothetical protein
MRMCRVGRMALALVALAGAPAPRASAQENAVGLAVRGAFTAGDMHEVAGYGTGGDLVLVAGPATSRVRLRVAAQMEVHSGSTTSTSAWVLWFPVTGKVTTTHAVTFVGAGPQFVFPAKPSAHPVSTYAMPDEPGYLSLYALVGLATVHPNWSGVAINSDMELSSSSSTGVLLGLVYTLPVDAERRVALELGVESLQSGACDFYGRPPVVPDGLGGYLVQTRFARISTLAFRLGFVRGWGGGRRD